MAKYVRLPKDEEEVSFYDINTHHTNLNNDDRSLNIILVGKTGAGKSSTGNTILREKVFHAEVAGNSVTLVCKKETVEIENTIISVIDTPGFCGSQNKKDIKSGVEECVRLSSPGPHAFLLVIQVGRFTEEDEDVVTSIRKNFGEDVLMYTIVLFTHVDQLKGKSLQRYIVECKGLENLITSCGGRYHSFNNDYKDNKDNKDNNAFRVQVEQLIEKIKRMLENNGGKHYSNEMFQKAQKELKFEERCHKAKHVASVAGLAIAGAVVAGAACAGFGAAAGAGLVVAGAVVAETAMGAAIGAGVVGGAGCLAGGIAGGVAGKKTETVIEKFKKLFYKKRD